MKRAIRFLCCGLMILIPLCASAQQTDINRYTLFTGFDYLISPARNLTERGFEGDFGVTAKPWLGLGADFSAMGSDVISGAGTISGGETIYAPTLRAVPPPFGPIDPNSIHVPFKSTTYTFAAGPQFYIRKWEKVTFLVRPGLGGIHENADINLSGVASTLMLLGLPVPKSQQTDTEFFIGAGAGFDVNVSRRVGVRFATDWVNTHLFSNLLTPRQNYIRFSIGPTWRWGHLHK
jgi:hypothetical protein